MHIPSKYDGHCQDCGDDIEQGQMVDWIRGEKGVWCLNCHPESTAMPSRSPHQWPPKKQWQAPEKPANGSAANVVQALNGLEKAVKELTAVMVRKIETKESF